LHETPWKSFWNLNMQKPKLHAPWSSSGLDRFSELSTPCRFFSTPWMAMVVMAIPGTRVSNRAVATSQVRQHISKDSSFLPCLICFRRCFLKWTFIAGLMANLVDQTRILLNSADPCDQAPPERERSRCARSVPVKPPTEKSDTSDTQQRMSSQRVASSCLS